MFDKKKIVYEAHLEVIEAFAAEEQHLIKIHQNVQY